VPKWLVCAGQGRVRRRLERNTFLVWVFESQGHATLNYSKQEENVLSMSIDWKSLNVQCLSAQDFSYSIGLIKDSVKDILYAKVDNCPICLIALFCKPKDNGLILLLCLL
jgi:hypothetical protein